MREEEESLGAESLGTESLGTVVNLLLREPEIIAWLDDYRPEPEEAPDDDTPAAA
jgi:hypothetical protein